MTSQETVDPALVTEIREGKMRNGFRYDNRVFFSYQEVLCYQYLQSLGFPGKKMHMEYRVGKKHFDYFPLKRVFWEHHPILRKLGKSVKKYAQERRDALDSNGFRHIPLIVSDQMFQSIDEIGEYMDNHRVDLRTGAVHDRLVILSAKREEIVKELLVEPLLF